jgi:uncharacterized 2Fe-2S/4Fe-4S cluster protein (DUF4445 family)
LGNKEFLLAASASAGPAFEGSGVSCGMRASSGAIEKVAINPLDGVVSFSAIGGGVPRGICGSGYISLISEMIRVGVIDKNGKIENKYPARIIDTGSGLAFVVAKKEEGGLSQDIIITEPDIENIKRAKGAIYSACAILVRHMGLKWQDIKKFYIAGGFGTYIDVEKAVSIGLLPDLERSRFVFVGNSSLSGSRCVLLSSKALAAAEVIARKITYFELSVEPGYMDEYMAALFFPHTDLSQFPSVK